MYLGQEHHVSRHVPYKKLLRDDNDEPVGFLPHAFEMREQIREKALSVNWLEFFGADHEKNVIAVIKSFRKSRKGRVGKNSAFGIGNVGILLDVCAALQHTKVRVHYDSKRVDKNNKSHARIIRLPINDLTVMQALATDVFTQLIANKDIS